MSDDHPFGDPTPGESVRTRIGDPLVGYRERPRFIHRSDGRAYRVGEDVLFAPQSDDDRLRERPETHDNTRKEEAVPNINDSFPSNYLKASDLQGRAVVVTMDRVEFEPVGRDKEMKAVLYFVGKSKGVVLNKTNAKKIIEIAGSALTEEWQGVAVVVYPTETEFAGETVDCIRIKAVQKAKMPRMTPPPPPPPPMSDDDGVDHGELSDDQIPF